MKTITFTNEKGGTGKTATAQAIGDGLTAAKAKVLFIDLDAQGSLSYILRADEGQPGAFDVLKDPQAIRDAIQTTPQGADIIRGQRSLATAGDILTDSNRAFHLKEALQIIKKQYDFCIIDTPPELGIITVNALAASDGAIITAQPDILSKRGIEQVGATIKGVKPHNKGLKVYGIVLTLYDGRKILHRQAAEQISATAAQMGTKVYETKIRAGVAVQEAQATRNSLFAYAPRSNPAQDYKKLLKEIKGDF